MKLLDLWDSLERLTGQKWSLTEKQLVLGNHTVSHNPEKGWVYSYGSLEMALSSDPDLTKLSRYFDICE